MEQNRRNDAEIARDRALVGNLYLKGWTQAAIAEKYHRTPSSVHGDLVALRKEWKAARTQDFDEAQVQELERIDRLERTYWDAWEKSLQDRETSTQETAHGLNARTRAQFRKQGSAGNPAYLAGVERCIQMRCKLLGLNAPDKLQAQFADKTGAPVGTIDERMAKYAVYFGNRAIVVDSTARSLGDGGGIQPGTDLEAGADPLRYGEIRPVAYDSAGKPLDPE